MRVTPLGTATPDRIRDTLESHGWDPARAGIAADGADWDAVHATGLDPATVERLLLYAGGKLGLAVITGDDWALVVGSRSGLSTLARPWGGPPELAELAEQVGLALPASLPASWAIRDRTVPLDDAVVVGILNVTPDSFSDGAVHATAAAAASHAEHLIASGAGIIDVGGESTRPGSPEPVSAEEELARVLPVVDALRRIHPDTPVSVDTVKAAVARRCLAAGASIINDVSGGRLDADLLTAVAEAGAGLVLMHSRGALDQMASYREATYDDLVHEVLTELGAAIERAERAGVAGDAIAIDPGLGFAKRVEDNWELLDQLQVLRSLGRPILVGPSRKRFVGAATGQPVDRRDVASAAACALAYERGARLFRVHDAESARDALAVAQAFRSPQRVAE
ncbi:MAG: dihydropteroate synthase [Gemmatimonadales bacterium]